MGGEGEGMRLELVGDEVGGNWTSLPLTLFG